MVNHFRVIQTLNTEKPSWLSDAHLNGNDSKILVPVKVLLFPHGGF